MKHDVEVVAYHGWGFDQSCWNGWKTQFAIHQVPFQAFDRGYFYTACNPIFSNRRNTILLTHSYGLHLYPVEQFQQVQVLVVLGGFVDFHPQDEREKRRSQRVLRQMIQECDRNPTAVLKSFKANCGLSSSDHISPESLNHSLLMEDLQNLNTTRLMIQAVQTIPTIVVFHGTADEIVPVAKGRELCQQLGQKFSQQFGQQLDQKLDQQFDNDVHYFEIPDAGHALPFTHTLECWHLLNSSMGQRWD